MRLRLVAKKDKIKNLINAIFKASFVSLFIFLFIAFLATSTTLKSSIYAELSTHTLSILVFYIFLISFVLFYHRISETTLIKLEKLYPEVPFIITGIGYSLLLVVFLVVTNYGYHSTSRPIPSKLYELTMIQV